MDISYHCPLKVADLGGRTLFGELYQSRRSCSYHTAKKCFQNVRTLDVHICTVYTPIGSFCFVFNPPPPPPLLTLLCPHETRRPHPDVFCVDCVWPAFSLLPLITNVGIDFPSIVACNFFYLWPIMSLRIMFPVRLRKTKKVFHCIIINFRPKDYRAYKDFLYLSHSIYKQLFQLF